MPGMFRRRWFPSPKRKIGFAPLNASSGLVGQSATTAVGAFTPTISDAIVGQSATTALGTLTLTVSNAIVGQSATAAVGTPSFNITTNVSLLGVQATTGFSPPQEPSTINLSGVAAIAQINDTVFNVFRNVSITGVSATAAISAFSGMIQYTGTIANPFGVSATAQFATFNLVGVPGNRVFIITGIKQQPIAAGIVMLPTSEDIAFGSNPYVIGSSQFYTIGEVHWSGVKKTEGVNWELVSPFKHIIHILTPPALATPIRLIYYRWDIGVRQGFKVNAYPVPFAFTGSTIVAERVPPPNLLFTVEYTSVRPGLNPSTMFARYPVIVDDLLGSHLSYDGGSGFQTFRPTGYKVYDTSDNKIYTWDGAAWSGVATANGTKFYVKRRHAVYELSAGNVAAIFTAGDPLTISVPEAIAYPAFGESVGKNLLVDAFSPNAIIDYPSAYEIAQNPGDFDEWATG